LLAFQTANPYSRRKEKASKTGNPLIAYLGAFNLKHPL
jgi:hypothetical protein